MRSSCKSSYVFLRLKITVQIIFLGISTHTGIVTAQPRDTFVKVGDMTAARADHTATLLLTGKVLIIGGFGLAGVNPRFPLASAELCLTPRDDVPVRLIYLGRPSNEVTVSLCPPSGSKSAAVRAKVPAL